MAKAYLLALCETGSDDYVISQLKKIDEVKEAHGTFGRYDVISKLESENDEKLKEVISKIIRKIPKIRSTLTLTASSTVQFGKEPASVEKDVLNTYMVHAYVLIHCGKSDDGKILGLLNDLPEVIEGDSIIGQYEIICKVSAPTYNDISEIITKKIRKIGNIKGTITLNIIPENE